jgi:hypothetical protein
MTLLTLFTIPKPFEDPHIALIQRNALASWQRLAPAVEVFVMGDDVGVDEETRAHGGTHVPVISTNEFGTPLLDFAFAQAAERGSGELLCYVNADIVLLSDFVAAARRLPRDPYLAIGRRWDTDISSALDFSNGEEALRQLAINTGTRDEARGSDYFLFHRGIDFGLPPFAVGRPGWDNWLIGRALELGYPLIDITPSVTVIHQNHDYRHVVGGPGPTTWEGPEAQRNRELATNLDRYIPHPYNATHLLTLDRLRRARSPRHIRARLEAFVALRPVAWPLRRLIRLLHRR